jgi:hypothetical protein
VDNALGGTHDDEKEMRISQDIENIIENVRRILCMTGTPSRIQSDRGEQLVAASKQLEAWDLDRVLRWVRRRGNKMASGTHERAAYSRRAITGPVFRSLFLWSCEC